MTLQAAVIGLGKVGSRFDEDPGRTVPWSHVGAYLALPDKFRLAGACDPDPENRAAFARRCPDVPLFESAEALLAAVSPDVLSICTPTQTHYEVFLRALKVPGLKALWCEKPLAETLDRAQVMVDALGVNRLPVVVSYNRRWLPLWQRIRSLIDQGAIGTVRSIRVAFPNRLLSVGSHAVDLALYLGGEPSGQVIGMTLPSLYEEGEPAVTGMLGFKSGAYGIIQVTGWKNRIKVEAEVIGDEGSIWAREDKSEMVLEKFVDSPRYAGYRELATVTKETFPSTVGISAFVGMAEELYGLATGAGTTETSGAAAALAVQRILHALAQLGEQK